NLNMGRHQNKSHVEIHGHRGARGHFPENTIISFIEAVKTGVDAIEMDVVISEDIQVVVSHEAWMNDVFCTRPDGKEVEKNSREKYNLFKMHYAEIVKYDCGKRGNAHFPLQAAIPAYKPLLGEVINKVDTFTRQNNLPPVKYNIEIKTEGPEGDDVFNPRPKQFAELVYNEVKKHTLTDRCNLQSFDVRILQEIKKINPQAEMALLVENEDGFEGNMNRLGFVPDTYSPDLYLVNHNLVQKVKDKGMRLIPWTVNEEKDMQRLLALGVDGIITDYPDRAIELIKKKQH
ncbi:MAG TPA: glycerophosphodiester phosphodiesterase family protein, partial [Bacteroidia bacterium]|nr:glycerophosphodiester phosphodiesterase family protein [Bacteroidia bacterium]